MDLDEKRAMTGGRESLDASPQDLFLIALDVDLGYLG
jgi:hypothetical protein